LKKAALLPSQCKSDHHRDSKVVDKIITIVSNALAPRLIELYAPSGLDFTRLNRIFNHMNEAVVERWRESAWKKGTRMASVDSESGELLTGSKTCNSRCHRRTKEDIERFAGERYLVPFCVGLFCSKAICSGMVAWGIKSLVPSPLRHILKRAEGDQPLRVFCKFEPWEICTNHQT
jgi:hypothetical protein